MLASDRVVREIRGPVTVIRVRGIRAVRAVLRDLLQLLDHGARDRIVSDTGIAGLLVGRHERRRPRVLHRTETTVVRPWRCYETNAVRKGTEYYIG